LISQPIVWVSLYSVATTGGGLPEGPYGLIGGIEGLAYLAVVGWAGVGIFFSSSNPEKSKEETRTISEKISLITIGIGLLVLVNLVLNQGCVPNAKPILDYSAYVNVCDP